MSSLGWVDSGVQRVTPESEEIVTDVQHGGVNKIFKHFNVGEISQTRALSQLEMVSDEGVEGQGLGDVVDYGLGCPTGVDGQQRAFDQGYMLSDGLEGVYIPDTVEPQSKDRQQLSRFPQFLGQSEGLARLDRLRAGGALCSTYPGLAGIYDRVRMSAKPNYRGCKIPVPSGLNIISRFDQGY